MKAVDVAGLPIKLGAAVRGARVFHPHGVLAAGVLTRVAEGGFGLPIESGEVVARVSKGAGTPGDLPDVVGLAIRMDPHEGDDTAWDILLASALGDGGWSKIIPFPTRSLRDAKLSTLQPLDYCGDGWWLRARLVPGSADTGLSLTDVEDQIDHVGMKFVLEQAWQDADFTPIAELALLSTVSEDLYPALSFDPTLNTTRGVEPGPAWLMKARTVAYRKSREGRGATSQP